MIQRDDLRDCMAPHRPPLSMAKVASQRVANSDAIPIAISDVAR